MHFHTSETSECGRLPAAAGIEALAAHGYAGVVVTDHYCDSFFDRREEAWPDACAAWLAGYRAARAAAPAGFTVLLGAEIRFFDSPNDYLAYGFGEDFLMEHPRLYQMTPARFSELAKEHGLFFAQAHPFRGYCTRCNPDWVDGIEVYNGKLRHENRNDEALAFAEKNGKTQLSGSDFHKYEDTARGGIYFPVLPADERELTRLLFAGDFKLRCS